MKSTLKNLFGKNQFLFNQRKKAGVAAITGELPKVVGERNANQQKMKEEKTVEAIRKRILQAKKKKEEKPFGIDDKHVIEARMELEELQKSKLRKKGMSEPQIESLILEERQVWIEKTQEASKTKRFL